jgi:hypothetical protein
MKRLRLVPSLLLLACASVSPRFEQDVATTFAQDDMRRLQTPDVELYYPAAYGEQARRVAARATECLRELRALQPTKRDHGRALLFLTSSNYNNAYVSGQTGGEPLHSLDPLSATDEIFHWYGLNMADTGDIACHEMFHFAHFEQIENVWRVVNAIFGPIVPSQIFLERWFTEGVAQYYEGRLHRASGRPHSPLYRGSFDSYVAQNHGLSGGDLSLEKRDLAPFSGAYLTGLYFVEWLARTYGEDKLWELMDVQGRSFFTPLGATLRFKQVYGLSAGALLDAFSAQLLAQLPARSRPANQQVVLGDVGQLARLATDPRTGTVAVVSQGVEQVPLLRLIDAGGQVTVERRLTQVRPAREWILAGSYSASGLSFSPDGRWLFLMNDDLISRGDTRSQLWKIEVATGEVTQVFQEIGRALGGSAAEHDGRLTYTYVEFAPTGGARVIERDLEAGTSSTLFQSTTSVGAPAWNPSHTRLAFSSLESNGWNVVVLEGDQSLTHLTTDGAFNYAPHWADEQHLVFARQSGPYLQAHRLDVGTGQLERVTDVPWGLIDPSPTPQGVAFVNREGAHWSIDTAPLASLELVATALPGPDGAPGPRYEPPDLVVEADEPYSALDHVFLPQLRVPAAQVALGTDAAGKTAIFTTVYASLSGKDRLGRHAWAINGGVTLPTLENAIGAAYRNLQLAPFAITASGERDGFLDQTYWTGSLSVDRTFFTSPVSLGLQTEVVQSSGLGVNKYVGAFASVGWSASESTPYAGVQRQLAISIDAAGYPRAVGSDRDMADLRVALGAAIPLPFSKRNSLALSLVGRALPGAPAEALRIGGTSKGTAVFQSNGSSAPTGPDVFLPGTLVEGLRGFDDFSLRGTATAIASARYRYSFIVDRGTVSTFYLFPSFFLRQVDLEGFGSAAWVDHGVVTLNGSTVTDVHWARAAGASVYVRTLWAGAFPFSLYYQFAWRFDFHLPPLHTVGFAFE